MDDLISRQDAIRWVKAECNPYGKPTLDYESGIKVIEHLERMSSVQSEKRTEERTETRACDLISRQAAIDAIQKWGLIDGLSEGQAIEILADEEKVPSAQPEIIRCKDCKYSSPNMVYGCRLERYSYHDDSVRMYSEDFCSKAERREDERFNQQTGCG